MALSNVALSPMQRLIMEYQKFQGSAPADQELFKSQSDGLSPLERLLKAYQSGSVNPTLSGDAAAQAPDTGTLASGPMSLSSLSALGLLGLANPATTGPAALGILSGNMMNDMMSNLGTTAKGWANDLAGLFGFSDAAPPGGTQTEGGEFGGPSGGSVAPAGGTQDEGGEFGFGGVEGGESGGGDSGGSDSGGGEGGYKRGGIVKDVGMKDTGPDQTHIRATPGELVLTKEEVRAGGGAKRIRGKLASLQRR